MGLQAVNNAASINPVTLADAKVQLRIVDDLTDPSTQATSSSDDTALQVFIDAAKEYVETETRQQLVSQMYTLTLDNFPGHGHYEYRRSLVFDDHGRQTILLPKPPLQSVSTITYRDTTGTTQTLSSGSYTVDTSVKPGRIILRPGFSWPATDGSAGCVTILFTAGYGSASQVPTLLKQAILLLAGSWFEFREDTVALRLSSISVYDAISMPPDALPKFTGTIGWDGVAEAPIDSLNGSGGVATGETWTEGEKAQIRQALGVDGTKVPAAGGDLQTAMRRAFAALVNEFGITSEVDLATLQQILTATD